MVHSGLGGDAALARLRERLRQRGLRLLLDFVPNHTGLDHPWGGGSIPSTTFRARNSTWLPDTPQNYTWVKRKQGDLLLAHGRDPYFPGWPMETNACGAIPSFASWPKSIGTWNGCCSSRDLITHKQRCTTACGTVVLAAGARTFPRGPGLSEQDGPLSGKPRQAAGSGGFLTGNARSRGGHHISISRSAVLPPGAVRRAEETHLSPSLPRPVRTQRPEVATILPAAACRAAQPMGARWSVATTPVRTRLEGNWTWDCFVAFAWEGPDGKRLLAVVNYAPDKSLRRR